MILSRGGSVKLKAFTENWSKNLFLVFWVRLPSNF
jgi:hypothetical protein